MRAISDLSTLVFLNILTVIFCIPIVTAGASLAAMHYVIMEMIEDRGGGLLQEFWKRFRENLRNATPVWLILLAAAVLCRLSFLMVGGSLLLQTLAKIVLCTLVTNLVFLAAFWRTSEFAKLKGILELILNKLLRRK